MIISKINILLFRVRTVLSPSFEKCHVMHYHGRVDVTAKRGSILKEMVTNKDRKKNWIFSITTDKPRARVFEKVYKPHRRRSVLNSLFIRNISDVLSTGEQVPELQNFGIEITGVQTSPCCRMLNVFWQVPVSKFDYCEDIGKLLNVAAPKIRAELISRNVLGRVPMIFFIRDCTNARVSAFELAMQKLEKEPKSESSIVPDDSFTKDIYVFRDSKANIVKKSPESLNETVKEDMKDDDATIPKKPIDMKCDVFGLNHSEMMDKVVALKKKVKSPLQKTAVISPDSLQNEDDLFSKIPGVCFNKDSSSVTKRDREAIFKRFHIERKMLLEKHKLVNYSDEDDDDEYYEEGNEENIEVSPFGEDFYEDENID